MRHLFHGQRPPRTVGGLIFVVLTLVYAGFDWNRGRHFQSACSALTPGTPIQQAEATLTRLGGRRVVLADPKPNTVEFRFKQAVGSDRLCEVESADSAVVKTSGWRSLGL